MPIINPRVRKQLELMLPNHPIKLSSNFQLPYSFSKIYSGLQSAWSFMDIGHLCINSFPIDVNKRSTKSMPGLNLGESLVGSY